MFGGNAGFGGAGGFGGYGGSGAPAESNGGGGGGGFNSVPGGGYGGFGAGMDAGGGGYGGAPAASQTAGLGGFMQGAHGGGDGQADSGQRQGGGPRDQTLMPVTVRMVVDAREERRRGPQGPDAPLMVSGREVSMITIVGCVESVVQQPMFKEYRLNDGTGRIPVKVYVENEAGAEEGEQGAGVAAGDHVRIFGQLRYYQEDLHVSCHHIARVESPNELPYHFIEVAHVMLSLTGKISNATKAAASTAPAPTSFGAPQAGPYGAAPAGGAAGSVYGAPAAAPAQPPSAGAGPCGGAQAGAPVPAPWSAQGLGQGQGGFQNGGQGAFQSGPYGAPAPVGGAAGAGPY